MDRSFSVKRRLILVGLGVLLAADEEPGADESDERESGFGDDEKAADGIGAPTDGVTAAPGFESAGEIR